MNTIAKKYLTGLRKAYFNNNAKESWEHFETIKHGATKKDIERLIKTYPNIPESLTSLLQYVDGTYFREYAGEKITFYLLGSDVERYPYYLLSSRQIIESQNEYINYYSSHLQRNYNEVEIVDKITNKAETLNWLHFSDCSNNGGTSKLFIDFSPSAKGNNGQVVRYLHDPDEFKVIAGSFDDYLEKLIFNEFEFINEDELN